MRTLCFSRTRAGWRGGGESVPAGSREGKRRIVKKSPALILTTRLGIDGRPIPPANHTDLTRRRRLVSLRFFRNKQETEHHELQKSDRGKVKNVPPALRRPLGFAVGALLREGGTMFGEDPGDLVWSTPRRNTCF